MSELLLEAKGLSKQFALRTKMRERFQGGGHEHVVALAGVSLALHRGETLGIVGESGSGKSTLAKVLVRLVAPDSGTVRFRGQDVHSATVAQLRALRRHLQLVYQDPYSSLNPRMRVGRAIAEPALVHGVIDRDKEASEVEGLLGRVGLPSRIASRYPRELSGGQRQRVAIARALASRPEVIIADEALSALDVSIQAQILNLFMELRADLGLSMIMISHQLAVMAQIADTIAVMYRGRVVEFGPTPEVFASPAHPYTEALLAAQPGRHQRGVRLPQGAAVDAPPATSCPYAGRCPARARRCVEAAPASTKLAGDHFYVCHFSPGARTSPT